MKKIKRISTLILALVFLLGTSLVAPLKAEEVSGTINVYTRDASSGTRAAFEEIVGFEKELTDKAFETSGNGDMAAKVGEDKNGIGYVSLTTDFEANKLQPVKYNGVEANVDTVVDGEYKLARPFNYVTRAAGDFESDEKEQLVSAFIAFLTESKEGMEIVAANGGIVDMKEAKDWDEVKADYPVVDQDNSGITLNTAGSTSVEKTLTAALEMFQPMAGMFEINVNQTGSGDGFKRVLGAEKDGPNAADIGFASRAFKEEETVEDGMASGTYCLDAVVIVVSAEGAQFDDLSQAQVKAIFRGDVTDFSEVADVVDEEAPEAGITTSDVEGQINVYTRDASSGTRAAFEEIVGFEKELTETAFETSANGDMAAKVGEDTNGIGYVSLTTDFEANNLKPLQYEGIEATPETVVDGEYKLARPFNYVTRAEGDFESEEKQELVAAFIAFLTESKEGMEVVAANGGIVDAEQGKDWEEIKKDYPIVDQDNSGITLNTAGSTSVETTLTAALEMFQPMAGMFEINVNQTGSGDGFKRVLGAEKDGPNAADIGFASRAFKEEETVEDGMATGTYCLDAVVVVVESGNSLENQTQEGLQKIFKGEITEWSEVE